MYRSEARLEVGFLAAVVSTVASFAAINLLRHVGKSSGVMRPIWLCVAGVATGFGIWSTHFIAMLAYEPGIPTGYDVSLTFISLLAAIVITIFAFYVASTDQMAIRRQLGGGFVGVGIAVMYYTGMAALEMPGRVLWNPWLVVVSLTIGVVFGAFALCIGLRSRKYGSRVVGGGVLALAICSHHFIGMASATLVLDPAIHISPSAIPAYWLAIMITGSCMVIFLLTFAGFIFRCSRAQRCQA